MAIIRMAFVISTKPGRFGWMRDETATATMERHERQYLNRQCDNWPNIFQPKVISFRYLKFCNSSRKILNTSSIMSVRYEACGQRQRLSRIKGASLQSYRFNGIITYISHSDQSQTQVLTFGICWRCRKTTLFMVHISRQCAYDISESINDILPF